MLSFSFFFGCFPANRDGAGSGASLFCRSDSWWIGCRAVEVQGRFNKAVRRTTGCVGARGLVVLPPWFGHRGDGNREWIPARPQARLEASPGGAHQRRRSVAGASYSQRRHSTPGREILPRIFNLCARLLFGHTLGGNAIDAPSGMFPGGDDGARWCWSLIDGGGQGPDRVFSRNFRVWVVKFQSYAVLFFIFRRLVVILYRPCD